MDEGLTVREAAGILRVEPYRVKQLVLDGLLPNVGRGATYHAIRIVPADLLAYKRRRDANRRRRTSTEDVEGPHPACRRPVPHTCALCSKPFEGPRQSRYCSKQCRLTAYRRLGSRRDRPVTYPPPPRRRGSRCKPGTASTAAAR